MTVDDLYKEWIDGSHKLRIKRGTYERYRTVYRLYIKDVLGSKRIRSVSPRMVQALIMDVAGRVSRQTKKPMGASTVNSVLIVLNLMYTYAVDFKILRENPCIGIKGIPEHHETTIRCFTRAQQAKIEKYIIESNNPEYFAIYIDLYSGLRVGELIALTWGDIDLDKGCLSVEKQITKRRDQDGHFEEYLDTPKTITSRRVVYLPNFLIKYIKEIKPESVSDEEAVFRKADGSVLGKRRLIEQYKLMIKRAGVPYLSFHCLRHTYATRCIERGMDVKTLAELLGHRDVSTTMSYYVHCLDEHKKKMVNLLKKEYVQTP